MYKLCKTEQSAARQRELELQLLGAMSTQRYEEISVSDLCEHIGLPRKSFYRYFSGKEGALHALVDHTLLAFETRFSLITAAEPQGFQDGLEAFFRFWTEQKPLLDALDRNGLSGILMERAIVNAVQDLRNSGSVHSAHMWDLQMHTVMFSVCGLMAMVIAWHRDGYPQDAAYMAKLAARMMTHPLYSKG